jgi:hypothetical protein
MLLPGDKDYRHPSGYRQTIEIETFVVASEIPVYSTGVLKLNKGAKSTRCCAKTPQSKANPKSIGRFVIPDKA